jgi:hypothetical protein
LGAFLALRAKNRAFRDSAIAPAPALRAVAAFASLQSLARAPAAGSEIAFGNFACTTVCGFFAGAKNRAFRFNLLAAPKGFPLQSSPVRGCFQ